MTSNFLASIFNWLREVIESAETPFAKFAIFTLPILSPFVPASVTGIRLTTELKFLPWLAFVTAAVLEMLGYVGAIAFIKAIYHWRTQRGSFLSVLLNGLAYGFYVLAMYQINVRLGFLAGDSLIVNQVFALLSFLTIPTGLLAAEHLHERDDYEEQRELRRERRDERIERERIRANAQANERTNERSPKKRTNERSGERSERTNAGELRTIIYELLDEYYSRTNVVAGVSDMARHIAKQANPDGTEKGYERYKGYISDVRKSWMNDRRIQ